MGLKERQFIAGLDLSWHANRIKDNAGIDIKFQLDDKGAFGGDIEALNFAENRGAQVVGDAFSYICNDNVGKEAIQGLNLKTILLSHTPAAERKLDIKDGVLTLSHDFLADSSSKRWDGGSLQRELENRL